MIIFRLLVAFLAVVMILFGAAMMVAPTPFGFVIVGLGLFLLATAAPPVVRGLRKRARWLDARLDALQDKGPDWLSEQLKRSDPEDDDADRKTDRTKGETC